MKILFLFCLMFFTSCAGYIRTQSTKMVSPEASGGLGKGSLEIRYESQNTDRLDFSDDTTDNPIDHQGVRYALAPMGELGLLERLDVFIQPHTASASVVGAKYQFLGKSRSEAQSRNFSMAILAGYGSGERTYNSSGDLEDFFNDDITKLEIEYVHHEMGLIMGYRWGASFLQYLNAIYQFDKAKGKVTKDNGPLQDASYKYTQHGMIYSTGFITYFGLGQLKVDYSHTMTSWSKSRQNSVNSVSTALGFNW